MLRQNALPAILTIGLLFAAAVSAQQKVDGIAAIVGNRIILESDINYLVLQYGMQTKQNVAQEPALYQKLSREFLQRMIDEKILLIKAEEDTIIADEDRVDQIVDQQVNTMIQQVGSQARLEEYYGAPLPRIRRDFRKQVADRLVVDQLRQFKFASVNSSRREVESFYASYRDSLPGMEETVDISHILLQVRPSEESLSSALARIQDLKDQLDAGAEFAELAREHSEDPSSTNGGDLGWFDRGSFVTEFEEAAFALGELEISDIVQTQFGFHIIQLLERQGERIHVRHILIQVKPTDEDEQRTIERLKDLRQQVLDGAEFGELAVKFSDDPGVTKDRGHLGEYRVGNFQYPQFEEAVEDLAPGEISDPFKTQFGYHVLRLNSRTDARQLTLDKDWQRIEQIANDFKRNQKFETWVRELREEIPIIVRMQI